MKRRYAYDVARDAKKRRLARPTTYYKGKPAKRRGYETVARTRGVYAQGEMKYFDSELATVALTASVTWATAMRDPDATPIADMKCLFAPKQGVKVTERIGKSCKLHKIKIRGNLVCGAQTNQTLTDLPCNVRLILVWDTQTNATQMTGAALMRAPVAADGFLMVQEFQNIDNFGRFKVLKDITCILQNPNISWDGTNMEQNGVMKPFKITKKFNPPVPIRFNAANGGTIADIVDNSFHILCVASSVELVPSINYVCRCTFKE